MIKNENWMLPDGVEEILPYEARKVETLRRRLLDLFQRWGYDLVIPPMMEFSSTLMAGLGQDLDKLTYKVVDQISGASMVIRSDMTPQTARMDAHSLKRLGLNRLCYSGHVLFTRAKSVLASRSPLQVGVELFGEAGLEADIEVISLLISSLHEAGLTEFSLDLGHVGIFRALAEVCQLTSDQEQELFSLLQAKAIADIADWVDANIQDPQHAQWLLELPKLSGSASVLDRASDLFAEAPIAVRRALDELAEVAEGLAERYPDVNFYLDLSELRGGHYHTGIVFAAFALGMGREIASGGRYDHIGETFGRARPATGFTADLIDLERLSNVDDVDSFGIFVPYSRDPELWRLVQQLRQDGERVVCATAQHQERHDYLSCSRQLVKVDGAYQIHTLT